MHLYLSFFVAFIGCTAFNSVSGQSCESEQKIEQAIVRLDSSSITALLEKEDKEMTIDLEKLSKSASAIRDAHATLSRKHGESALMWLCCSLSGLTCLSMYRFSNDADFKTGIMKVGLAGTEKDFYVQNGVCATVLAVMAALLWRKPYDRLRRADTIKNIIDAAREQAQPPTTIKNI